MDFIISLTHFCEVHGPTSILCSQVVPGSCEQCDFDSSDVSSSGTPLSSHHDESPSLGPRSLARSTKSPRNPVTPPELAQVASSMGCATSAGIDPPLSPPSSAPPTSQRIEDHPWFLKGSYGRSDTDALKGFSGGESDRCPSCSLSIPEDVSRKLPPGAPGTVLRSREMVHSCSGNHSDHDDLHFSHLQQSSSPSSIRSSYSSDSSCHPHIVTYLSLRGPPNPSEYALLRRASIRTLSCELLPRGLSSGPLSFGDSVTGYTIAYVFRLPDPMARGKRRSYALVALAGKDAGKAFRACPVIWRVFSRIASSLVGAAEKHQEREKRREEKEGNVSSSGSSTINGRAFTPVSSFLTGRRTDPDGQPRRAGQIRARNLTEIVGNEYIFAELHAQFVALLQQLGVMFGGARTPEPRSSPPDMYEHAGDGFFSSRRGSSTGNPPSRRPSTTSTGHYRRERSGTGSSSVNLPPAPKPIPISHRWQLAT